MKRKLIAGIGAITLAASIFTAGVYAASDIRLFINGKQVNADIQIVDGSSYVPLKVVSEALGADVKWDGSARTININAKMSKDAVAPTSPAKSYAVNVNVESGPMKLAVSKVTLDPMFKKDEYSKVINAVIIDVTVENTSTDTVKWYPDQATIVLNTKEQIDSIGALNSDRVGGDFIGKVVKKGKLVYEVSSNLNEITSITYKVNGAFNDKLDRLGDNKITEILLK